MKYNAKIYRRTSTFKSKWASCTFDGITGYGVTLTIPDLFMTERKPRLKKRRR